MTEPEALHHLLRNFPFCDEYCENSFLEKLYKQDTWDEDEFWLLDMAIYELAELFDGDEIPRSVTWPVVRVYSFIFTMINAHHNPSDGYQIKGMDNPMTIHEWRDRAEQVFEGFFSGEMPGNQYFEKMNPLLK